MLNSGWQHTALSGEMWIASVIGDLYDGRQLGGYTQAVTPGVPLGLSRFAGWVWFGELSGFNVIVIKMRVKNTTNIDKVASP